MAEQRPTFRFRLPWLPAARPMVDTQTPTQPTTAQIPSQPTTTTPAQRPPFRPAGIAPTLPPPPQAQALPRTEPQPPSPSRTSIQSRVSSQPASPSRVSSQPASPSRAANQSRAASQAPSPSRLAPQPAGQTSSLSSSTSVTTTQVQPSGVAVTQPPSPSHAAPQTRAASQPARTVTEPPSPPKTLQPTTREGSQPPPSSTESPPPVSEKDEPKPAVSQPQSLEPQPKAEITSDTPFNSQSQTTMEKTTQPNGMATQPSNVSGPVAAVPTPTVIPKTLAQPQKSDSSTITADPKPLAESDRKSEEMKEGKQVVEKSNGVTYEEPKQTKVTELGTVTPGSKAQTKEQLMVAFQAQQKQPEKQEILGTKETLATSISNGKQNKTMISHLKDKSMATETRQKPATSNGEQVPLHKEIRNDISKLVHKMAIGHPKHPIDEKPVSVITLAGENRGASMHLGSESAKREGAIHIHRGYKIHPDESAEATTDGEGSSKGRRSKYANTKEDQATKTYINSNIQAVNNSIVFSSSITEKNPGVQLVLSHNPREPTKSTNRTESLEARKAEFNITPAQKLTYEPTVRRRCLRGLFMEPSDSDPDNPEKPRRHGCQYGRGEE